MILKLSIKDVFNFLNLSLHILNMILIEESDCVSKESNFVFSKNRKNEFLHSQFQLVKVWNQLRNNLIK
jgi:hypothetical protein